MEMMELKKGTWTAEEDQKLVAYIQEHGHGSWRALPAKAGLRRCGKSCRLRWTNYLKPDIKRGKFSLQEEQTIIQLHALVGNRWSTIATHLPKRTDNEIKNYWNTHLAKRLTKMGIDPVTHKPKNDAMGSRGQSKDDTTLSHMAQWESARLEAEARLVREYKLARNTRYYSDQLGSVSASTRHQLLSRSTGSSLDIKTPSYLDVLKAWQSNSPHASASAINNFSISSTSTSLETSTSTLNFPENTCNIPNHIAFIENSMIRALPDAGINAKGDFQSNWKELANQTTELQQVIFPNHSTSIMDNFGDHLLHQNDHDGLQNSSYARYHEVDGIGNCSSEYQELENYWDNILN